MLRAFDANVNRAAEGLRVLEDTARFFFDDAEISAALKNMRHELRQNCPQAAIADRRADSDVGIGHVAVGEKDRRGISDLVCANAKRAQEALRALEELGKLYNFATEAFAGMRYALYDLEKRLLALIPSSRLSEALLYVLIDSSLCADPCAIAQAAQAGGAGIIQLRAKGLGQRAYAVLAKEMRTVLDQSLFIVNDHVAIAKAIAADGVHLGQDDMSVADARAVLGPLAIIGLSTHSKEQIVDAEKQAIDYIGIGPIYETTTKPLEPCRGLGLLDAAKPALPSYAIGGFNAARIQDIRSKIPHGVAVAGAVCNADDPQKSCEELIHLLAASEE